jgi:hypothetical protein
MKNRLAVDRTLRLWKLPMRLLAAGVALSSALLSAQAQEIKIAKSDTQIDGLDAGVKIFVREKMAEGNTTFADDNVVLFLHGATGPSTCDFDLSYKDYSWADWLVKRGYVVYMATTAITAIRAARRPWTSLPLIISR